MSRSPAHRIAGVLTSAMLLAGCVPTRTSRIGADDGSDACMAQLVALDSTGNFFAEDIVRGAAIGALGGALIGGVASGRWQGALIGAAAGSAMGAAGGYLAALQQRNKDQAGLNTALASDLQRENQQLDRTQLAFDQLIDCRLTQAARVRADYRFSKLPRDVATAQMADIRNRTERDIALARTIDQRIGTRGGEFDTAIENVAPGTKDKMMAARARPAVPVQVARPLPLLLRPDPAAPEVRTIPAREAVQVRPASGGFSLVETASGQRGYVATEALGVRAARVTATAAPEPSQVAPQPGDVRSLAATNIARREGFSDSLTTAQQAVGSGFELAS